ncbi:glycerate kinase [Bifidobacterium favimelis]|uniref:Glycerate kinase n=1 Tax=Bifidobacterium favimelis TaxID=3122979 RepID=A0ABU8ZPK4_9BIFI
MKIIIAPDSFKGCMTAKDAAEAIREGLTRVLPDAEYDLVPMADGGEGTVQSLVDATGGSLEQAQVTGPLGKPVTASYGILGPQVGDLGGESDGSGSVPTTGGKGGMAVIEMAEASGIGYVDETTKNPWITTTYGTGELMRKALDQGVHTIILGIGGSATNDGGAGMAQALGARLLDKDGKELGPGGGALADLSSIDISGLDPRLAQVKVLIASDVTNPLVGATGASAVFGPQKGATPEMIERLDANLTHYADVIARDVGRQVAHVPGAGGAGGLGAGLLAFTNASMDSGVTIVSRTVRLAQRAADADICFTGEGGIDFQTQYGKTPMGVAQCVKKANPRIAVVALAGNVGDEIGDLYNLGIDAIFPILPGVSTLETALSAGRANLARSAENVGRLVKVVRRQA